MICPYMKHILYNQIVVDAGDELIPAIRIHPFNNKYVLTEEGDTYKAREYLNKRFKHYKIFPKGREALYAALCSYNLQNDDLVTILTTSNNFYISKCVTREVDKICKWNREVTEETKVIIFNHEFGFPRRDMKEIAEYGLPIIEDCAHTFYDEDSEIGKYSDWVVYSLPKAFPMQMGGVLVGKNDIDAPDNVGLEYYVFSNLSKHVNCIDEYKSKRQFNFQYLCDGLESIGIHPYFTDDKAIPGTFLFRWNVDIDYPKLKTFMYENGVECSVFYGQNAFFVPVHQELSQPELDYIICLLHYFNEFSYE